MRAFDYLTATTLQDAIERARSQPGGQFIAGGTNLVDLMKYDVTHPGTLIGIHKLPLRAIEDIPNGGLRLGALATNAATAYDARVQARYPVLSSAILAGASAQLRNAATNGGNLNQRTRCYYFYNVETACNKRQPGSGCDAIGGVNRVNGILGTSPQCIATHPSDMCIALSVLNAEVRLAGPDGERVVPFAEYHRLPGETPWLDNNLRQGELVIAIDLPCEDFSRNYTYLKLRDRQSYAFALVSVAVVLTLHNGLVAEARIALGGVAHKPWRVPEAEIVLLGKQPDRQHFEKAAELLLAGAHSFGGNDVKIILARRAIVRACEQAAAGTPQSQITKRIA